MLQAGIEELLRCLKADGFSVEIETNGSVDISKFCAGYSSRLLHHGLQAALQWHGGRNAASQILSI